MKATIVDSRGRAISGIYVVATPLGAAGGKTLTAITNASGLASFAGVPAATYTICVQGPGTVYLDLCRWGKPAQVTVAAGQQATAAAPAVVEGSVLRVRLDDDANRKYMAQAGNRPEPLIGVLAPGKMYYPLRNAVKDDKGRGMDIAIPFNTQIQLLVHPGRWQLADEKGAEVGAPAKAGGAPTTANIAVTHTPGGNNPEVKLRVTGLR